MANEIIKKTTYSCIYEHQMKLSVHITNKIRELCHTVTGSSD